jgi:hypothetical protein
MRLFSSPASIFIFQRAALSKKLKAQGSKQKPPFRIYTLSLEL